MGRRKTKPSPAKIALAIPAEAGREYRDIAETALKTATPDELRQLVLLFSGYADGLSAKVFDRNECCRQLLAWGKIHDRARLAYFKVIEITNVMLGRALGLALNANNLEQREELMKLAASGLEKQVAVGCPEVTWPDESVFPLKDQRPN
jgi:hypothetical protein